MGVKSKALYKKYILSLDLNTDSENTKWRRLIDDNQTDSCNVHCEHDKSDMTQPARTCWPVIINAC